MLEREDDTGVDHGGVAARVAVVAFDAAVGDVLPADAELEAVAAVVDPGGEAGAEAGGEVEACALVGDFVEGEEEADAGLAVDGPIVVLGVEEVSGSS